MFKDKFSSIDYNDHALWKQFWYQNQRYHTICLKCTTKEREGDRKLIEVEKDKSRDWDAMMLTNSSEAILSNWYRNAHDHVFGSKGRKRRQHTSGDISDDNEEDFSQRKWIHLSPAEIPSSTSIIATFWLRSARAKLQRDRLLSSRDERIFK